MNDLDKITPLDENGTWPSYRRMVISDLRRIDAGVFELSRKLDQRDENIDEKFAALSKEIAVLQAKSGGISAIISAAVGAVVAFIAAFIGRGH
jgi:hypothetical protein